MDSISYCFYCSVGPFFNHPVFRQHVSVNIVTIVRVSYNMYWNILTRESQMKTLKINTQFYYSIYGFHLTHPRINVHLLVCHVTVQDNSL